MNRIIKTAIFSAAIPMLAACAGRPASAPAALQQMTPVVEVNVAGMQDVDQDEVYSSTVLAYATNNIAPQAGLRIRRIMVDVGDFVNAGQILAEMDKFQLEQAQLKLVNDSTELCRLRSLYEAGGLSQSDFDAVELAYRVSRSSFQNLLENTILRAPITGVVTARNYDKGDMYTMGQPVFTVQQITPVKLLVAVSESDYPKVKKGDKATLVVDAVPGKVFDGVVDRIYPVMDASSHTFNVEVKVDNRQRELRPGMYAKVTLSFGVYHSIVIPDVAVMKQQGSGQRMVMVVGADGKASQKFVTLGRHFDNQYEILSGLDEGDRVIVKGQSSLRGGETVEVR